VLLNILHTCGDWAHGLDGKVVAGTSAGAEILSKYSYNLDTSELSENLGLLPIKFIPHWQSDYKDIKNNSVDWKKVYHELKNYKEDLEIVTLREGEFKVYENITV